MVNELGDCSKIAQKKIVMKAKKITANILSLVTLSYLGILMINNKINNANANNIIHVGPSRSNKVKSKRLYVPPEIFETGSFKIHANPNMDAMKIMAIHFRYYRGHIWFKKSTSKNKKC